MATPARASLRLAVFALTCALGWSPAAEAGSITVTSFTNTVPGVLAFAPVDATFTLDLAYVADGTAIGALRSADLTFSSGEGETVSTSWVGSAATKSFASTFTYDQAGTYTVTATGTASAVDTRVSYIPVYQVITIPIYDEHGNFVTSITQTIQSGYQTQYTTVFQSYAISAQLLYGVGGVIQVPIGFIPITLTPGPVTPGPVTQGPVVTSVPEAGTLTALVSGVLALVGMSRFRRAT